MTTEQQLIAVAAANDSEALEALFNQYLPLINKVIRRFYIRHYELEDWYQEARLCCFQTCQHFDASRDSKFGAFFKLCWQNYATGLVRRHLAAKRIGETQNISLEESVSGGFMPSQAMMDTTTLDMYLCQLPGLFETLTPPEKAAWQRMVSGDHLSEGLTEYQFRRARTSCRKKFAGLLDTNLFSDQWRCGGH
ncbi:MAG: sigma-70 family RNA polymerase sigma factor [Schleiferilactobacillus perolens]|uniref:sigma-70 family RNA polymerase sigma factor n=1 Tax=Schleiferilactobacillus perolens TaxID=100468 RepID=UPI0039EC91F1